jgi:hypothetical protein
MDQKAYYSKKQSKFQLRKEIILSQNYLLNKRQILKVSKNKIKIELQAHQKIDLK